MRVLTETEFSETVGEFYSESKDDDVGLWEIAKVVEDLIGTSEIVIAESLRIVKVLLEMGLEAGCDPQEAGGYKPWPEQDAIAILGRIEREWIERGKKPNIGDAPYFVRPN